MVSSKTANTATTKYYAVYSSEVTIYRPSSDTEVGTVIAYRNEYLTSTSEMNTVLATGATGTSTMGAVSGIIGNLSGFSKEANSTKTYTSISALNTSDTTTAYAIAGVNVTATFYYFDGSKQADTTASGTKTVYCSSTSTATVTHATLKVPTLVSESTGMKKEKYANVSKTVSNTTPATVNTSATKYYAYYTGVVNSTITATFYYYNGSTVASTTSTGTQINNYTSKTDGKNYTVTTNKTTQGNITIPNAVISSKGQYSNGYAGVSASTGNMTPATVDTGTTKYYAFYRANVDIYKPKSESSAANSAEKQQFYRNSYYGTANKYTTVLSTSNTGTSNQNPTIVDGYKFSKLTTKVNSEGTSYTTVSAAAITTTTTFYTTETKSVSATFYYYEGSQKNVANSGTRTLDCTSTSKARITQGSIEIPSVVSSSKGVKGEKYVNVSSAVSSTTAVSAVNTGTGKYYAYYTGDIGNKITATFYYYNGGIKNTTATGTQTINYTSKTNGTTYAVTTNNTTQGSITVPDEVKKSVGQYGNAYIGVSNTLNTMSTSTVNTSKTKYYAVYKSSVTEYYNKTSRTIYRNSVFTSDSALKTVLSTTATGVSNLTTSTGPTVNGGAVSWYAYSTANNTTASYKSVDAAAKSSSSTLYTVYKYTVKITYNGNGQTSGTVPGASSATAYCNYNGSSTPGVNITLAANGLVHTNSKTAGWNTSADGSGTVYNASTSYKFTLNVTLYSFWAHYEELSGSTHKAYYTTLPQAFSKGTSGNIIKPLYNRTESSTATLASNKTLTLDLNSKTIQSSVGTIINNGTLTIKGSGGITTQSGDIVNNTGTLTISAGTLTAKSGIGINNTGTLSITGGSITSSDNSVNTTSSKAVTISGGTLKSDTAACLYCAGTGTVTISGGKMSGNASYGVYNNSTGTIKMTNGTVEGKIAGIICSKRKFNSIRW